MFSTSNSIDEGVKSFTTAINSIINNRLKDHTMTEEDATVLGEMLARIQTDPKLLNAVYRFNDSVINLDSSWSGISPGVTLDISTKPSCANLAHILVSLLV